MGTRVDAPVMGATRVRPSKTRTVTVLYVEHLATETDMSKARGESKPQTLYAHRRQSPYVGARQLGRLRTDKEKPRHATQNLRPPIQSSQSTTTRRQPRLPLVQWYSHRSRPPHRMGQKPRRQHRPKQHGALMQTLQRKTRTGIQGKARRLNQTTQRTQRKHKHTVFL